MESSCLHSATPALTTVWEPRCGLHGVLSRAGYLERLVSFCFSFLYTLCVFVGGKVCFGVEVYVCACVSACLRVRARACVHVRA